MKLLLTPQAREDIAWFERHRPALAKRVDALLLATRAAPFTGIGKPEPLKLSLQGLWSRRVDKEHRLVYRVTGDGDERRVEVLQCRFHY